MSLLCGPAPRQAALRPALSVAPSLSRSLPVCGAADMAAEQQQFYLLLQNLLSPDNGTRKQAEVSGAGGRRCAAMRFPS